MFDTGGGWEDSFINGLDPGAFDSGGFDPGQLGAGAFPGDMGGMSGTGMLGDFTQQAPGNTFYGGGIEPGTGMLGSPGTPMPSADQSYTQRLMSFFSPQGQQGGGGQQGPGMLDKAALALPALGAVGGLAGLFQQMSQGRPVQTQTTSRGPASPQEQALLAQTLQQLSQMQGLAQNAEIQQAINRLASGQLPISSDLVDQVTKAFSSVAANTAESAVEGARERGFSGGTELLGGAGSPQYSRQMAQVQHDVSQSLVNLALGLPQAASNMNAQQFGLGMQPINAQMGLLGQMGAQAPQTTTQTGPPPSILGAMGQLGPILGGLGGALGGYSQATRPQPQPVQFNLSGAPGGSLSGL